LTADGGRVLETSLFPCEHIKVTFKANKGADLGVDYVKGPLYATGALDVMDMSKLTASACFSINGGLKAGGDATIGLTGGAGVTGLNVGASYAAGPLFAAVTAAPTQSKVNIGLVYKVNSQLSLASQTSHSKDVTCDVAGVGGALKLNCGTLKAKYNSSGTVSACFTRQVASNVSVTASGSVLPSDFSTFEPGLSINM